MWNKEIRANLRVNGEQCGDISGAHKNMVHWLVKSDNIFYYYTCSEIHR